MMRYLSLVLFVGLAVGGGVLVGLSTPPGEWYRDLAKPDFNPPNWLFGPVWTVLYAMIGVSGWLIWRENRASTAMTLWWVQMGLNFLWSPVFFAAQEIGLALIVISAMFLVTMAFIVSAWRPSRLAALLFVPYAAWVGFASVLNASIYLLN